MSALSSWRAILSGAVLAAAAIGFAGINPYLPGGGDNAAYIAEAESWLATGQRLRLYEAGAPPATLKPPLFPLMLAGVERFLGRNVAAMKAMLVLFAAAAVWAAGWALRCGLEEGGEAAVADAPRQAALLALWFALAPTLTLTTHDVLSDVPFTFLAFVALGCTARVARPQASWRALVWPAAVLTLATLLRSAGILVAGVGVVYLGLCAFLRRKDSPRCFRRLLLGGIVLAVLAGALLWYQQRGEQTYSRSISESVLAPGQPGEEGGTGLARDPWHPGLGASLLRKALAYCIFLPAEVGAYEGLGPRSAVYVLAFAGCCLAALGIVTMLRRRQILVPLCFLLLQAPLLFYPWLADRFYLPALPLWLCLLWVGVSAVGAWARARPPGLLPALAFALALIPSVSLCGTWLDFGRSQAEGVTIVEWIAGPAVLAALLLWAWRWPISPQSAMATTRRRRIFMATFGVFLLLAASRCVSENVVRERRAGPAPAGTGWRDLYDAACWLKSNAAPDDAVVSDRISLVWFWSGLRGVPIPRTRDHAQAERQLQPANWIILDGLAEDQVAARYLAPFLKQALDVWEPIWRRNQTWVLRRKE